RRGSGGAAAEESQLPPGSGSRRVVAPPPGASPHDRTVAAPGLPSTLSDNVATAADRRLATTRLDPNSPAAGRRIVPDTETGLDDVHAGADKVTRMDSIQPKSTGS